MQHLNIKAWAEEDRPREKLILKGPSNLSDAELIAILIRNGTKEHTALDLARQLTTIVNNDLYTLGRQSVSDLAKIKGIGQVKAITLVAALELGRRRRSTEAVTQKLVTGSQDVIQVIQPILADLYHEEFWIILLNRANKIIGKKMISSGGMAGTVVDPRIIFREALDQRASGIILCHNHPSGNPKPSEADIQLTKKIKDAGQHLEITVLDHLIIAGTSFYSFADEGVL
ncbi:DNA repair protein RadC [soil metagenome]